MKQFKITKDVLRKAWSNANQYWFALENYEIVDASSIDQSAEDVDVSAHFISLGYIPFVTLSTVEVMQAYTETLTNKKLKTALSKINEESYAEAFWKYYEIYPELSNGYNDFEDDYALKTVEAWCNENAVEYCK